MQQASGIKKSRIKQCMRIVTVAIMIAVVCGEIALYVQIRLPKVSGIMEYGSTPYIGMARKKNGRPISCVQSDMFNTLP